MIITDRFVYLHMPKTGGTFVEKVLAQLLAGRETLYLDTSTSEGRAKLGGTDHHETWSQIPLEYRDRPILFTIRNPYDHYVSHYEFGWWKSYPGSMFNDCMMTERYASYPELTFEDFILAINDWSLKPSSTKEAANFFGEHNVGHITWENVRFIFKDPYKVVDRLEYYMEEHRYRQLLPDIHFVSMHSLNHGLYNFLKMVGWQSADVEFILNLGKILPPEGGRDEAKRWESYYTPDLKRMVREKDRLIFAMFPEFDV